MEMTLPALSAAIEQAVETAARSVMRVEARRRRGASGTAWGPDVVVTADHVVEDDDRVRVGLADGAVLEATVAGRDPSSDVAVLRVYGGTLPVPQWAGNDEARVGQLVLAVGRPGRTPRAALGILSAVEDGRRGFGGRIGRYLLADAALYPGFSGGALVDAQGRVLGMNTAGLARGLALAIPAATLRGVVEPLLAHGRLRRGYLGISAQPVRLPTAFAERAGQEGGLLVLSVEAEAPAARAGLLLGDIVLDVDGHPTERLEDLLGALGPERVGASVPARILRGGEGRTLTVVIGER